jgi:DNA polymerase-1
MTFYSYQDLVLIYPQSMKRLFLLDGSALAYRAHFAFASNPLINKNGLVTSAVFGFVTSMLRIIEEEAPEYIAVVFDHADKTFRHIEYPEYKATRQKMPDDLRAQLPYIREVVEALKIPFLSISGFEADDIIGTLAKQASKKNIDTYMVTGDKDFLQLLDPHTFIYGIKNRGGEVEILNENAPLKKWGVSVQHVTDLLALMGDASDNVPGVPGIGEKTAGKLVQDFGSLEQIYEKIEKVPEKLQKKLIEFKDQAFLCKRLVTIHTEMKLPIAADELVQSTPDAARLANLYRELEFHSLLKKIEGVVDLKTTNDKNYQLIRTNQELDDLISNLKKNTFSVDTETTGLHPMGAEMVGTSFSYETGKACYISFAHSEFSKKQFIEKIKPVLENPDYPKGGQNIKFDRHIYMNEGVNIQGITFDTMIESYLLEPNSHQHGLDLLALKHLQIQKIPFTEISQKGKLSIGEIDITKLSHYACEDADVTRQLHQLFSPKIKDQKMEKIYKEVEIPLIEVLGDIERNGIALDKKLLEKLSSDLDQKITGLEKKILEIAGEEFNIKSPKQLGPILFEKLKIHEALGIKKIKKTKTGYSTDQETLEKYESHPIVPLLLEYRNLTKLKSTYIDTLPTLVHPKTGRIHTSFNQTVAATGRLSSSDPNMQNIPIRNEIGREIRKAFVAKDSNHVMLSADYSQIELRFLAHLTDDPTLIKTFEQNEDIHTITAALIFQKSFHEVTSELRSRAKTINFGIIYGMGPQRLARETQISVSEAKLFIESYFNTYAHVKDFFAQQLEFAKQHGFVETIMGRRRPLPDINSKNPMLQSIAERMACNTPLQGSAADLIKVAMINIHKALIKEKLQTKMLLQVHDELVFEVPESELSHVTDLVKKEMEQAIQLKVPLLVETSYGPNWNS